MHVRRSWLLPCGILLVAVSVVTAQQARPTLDTPLPPPPDVAAPPPDAVKTASGLATKVLQAGTGTQHPTLQDMAVVHYTGWTTDGKMFDSSYARGAPSTFPVGRLIKGFTEGLLLMTTGEKRRLWVPEELAYGGREGRPAGMLVFDVELIDSCPTPRSPHPMSRRPQTMPGEPRRDWPTRCCGPGPGRDGLAATAA